MTASRAGVLDVVAVLAFVAVGRRSHAEGLDPVGLAQTAWPFLVGLVLGWVVLRSVGRPPHDVLSGAAVWGGCVVGGLALRSASGGGTAPSFVLVAAVVLAVLLLGWRGVVLLVRRRGVRPGT